MILIVSKSNINTMNANARVGPVGDLAVQSVPSPVPDHRVPQVPLR